MRRLFFIVVCIALSVAQVFAAGDQEKTTSGSRLIIDAFVQQTPEYPDLDPAHNKLSAYLQEQYNVEFDFVVASAESLDEKKSVLLASGDYPSVFYHGRFSKRERLQFGSLGILLPLNDLIEQHSPNISSVLATDNVYAEGVIAPDGSIYALATAEICYHCMYTPKYWINTVWLDELGLKMPESTEEFEVALEAFKTRDPNGNGIADEIPLSGAINTWWCEVPDFLLASFIYADPRHYLFLSNGKVDLAAAKPEFRDGLRYVKRLYDKGLVDPQAFTQNHEQFRYIANRSDKVILGSYSGGVLNMGPEIGYEGDGNIAWLQYRVMPPLRGPSGKRHAVYAPPSFAEAGFAITNRASNEVAQRAMEIQDWFFTLEGGIEAMFGPRVYQWDWPVKGALGMRGEPAIFQTYFERASPTITPTFAPPFYLSINTFLGWAQDQDTTKLSGYERFLTMATDEYAKYKPDGILPGDFWFDDNTADMYAQYRVELQTYIRRSITEFIIGLRSIESDWDAYLKDLYSIGLAEYLEIVQAAYDADQ